MKDSLEKITYELKQGNNSCLKTLFLEHSDFCIKNLLRKTNCSVEDAEDILVDAVINFREKVITGKIDYLTSIRNYLFTTCYNMWLVKTQREKRFQSKLPEIVQYYNDEIGNENYQQELMFKEKMIEVSNQGLESLGEKCKAIISYFYLEKRSMEEIADLLGFSNAAVAKTSKSRCFKKLISFVNEVIRKDKQHTSVIEQ